jgi:hypothetical protein
MLVKIRLAAKLVIPGQLKPDFQTFYDHQIRSLASANGRGTSDDIAVFIRARP